ncbi:MAG TPA: dienelactone hydrolase family protein [Fimbriimonadaceae bacterium]|nr:dienelactone hydrolase family protein [Fimbriimonadaceae bacterium]
MIAIAFLVALQSQKIETFNVNGVQREATVVAPTAGSGPAPLVFVFHGHGGNMRNAQRTMTVDKLWPEAIVVYPQGLPSKGKTDPQGVRNGWQQNPRDENGRDLAFFDAILASMKKEFKVDTKRIYVTGHSNGGRFTYLLWAERGDTFAAVAPCSSPAIGLIRNLKPKPAFVTAGEQDKIVSFQSQEFSINAIRRILRTDPAKAKKSGYTTLEPGPNGMELGMYIFPGPHSYPSDAVAQAVEFFKRHPK